MNSSEKGVTIRETLKVWSFKKILEIIMLLDFCLVETFTLLLLWGEIEYYPVVYNQLY